MIFQNIPGATPLSPDEIYNLIPKHLTNQNELNEFEQYNITFAEQWAFTKHKPIASILTIKFLNALHKKMFNQTWRWAGQFRTKQTNIGCESYKIQNELALLFDDTKYQIQNTVYPVREIAARLHHRMVSIHPYPNGNGRLSRLFADITLFNLGEPRFSWGRENLTSPTNTRDQYIEALQAADQHDYTKLLKFVDS